jgi:hypothetical protein
MSRVLDRGTTRRRAGDIAEDLTRAHYADIVVTRQRCSLVAAFVDFDEVLRCWAMSSSPVSDDEIATEEQVVTSIRQIKMSGNRAA